MVSTNELLFVFMIHVYMDMEILKPSTNFLLGLLELRFFFHDVLTFSFMQVKLYAIVGKAFMSWDSIPPYIFVVTN